MTHLKIYNLCARTKMFVVFVLIIYFSQSVQSWELAVATNEQVGFFITDTITMSQSSVAHQLTDLYALTYDALHDRLIFSVNHADSSNHSIYTYDFQSRILTPVVPRQKFEIQGLAYDSDVGVLFWTDGNGHTIWSMELPVYGTNKTRPEPEKLMVIQDEVINGIAISFCQKYLFWTNSNHTSASVDRSSLDGSGHVRLITKDVFQPTGITVDEMYAKLYWTDDQLGIFYRIERSNLDGSGRELMVRRTNQEPFAIATFNDAVYWTDIVQNSIWMISSDMSFPNHTKAKLEPDIFFRYKGSQPNGIVAFRNMSFECDQVRTPAVSSEAPQVDEIAEEDALHGDYCLNSGDYRVDSCYCKRGFVGKRCETSVCYQHCLNGGQCLLDKQGDPWCRCQPGFTGDRCSRDVCEGFCMNDGRCHLTDLQPQCSCGGDYSGPRCEVLTNSTVTTQDTPYFLGLQCSYLGYILGVLLGVVIILLAVLAFLVRRIVLLQRRRLRRRFIYKNPAKNQTPMTARPSPPDQCEISIENCCNMNVCETPCFEPNLRMPSAKSLGKKTDDKKNLLKNMEEGDGEDQDS